MFRITVPSDFECPARSWKDNSSTMEEAITRTIAFLNNWNNGSLTELPEGTQIVSF